jgi:hypothetical protein
MARRPPPRPQSTGLPPAFFGVVVILIAAVAVLFVVSKMNPPADDDTAPAATKSPFADVPEEEPPGGRGKAGSPFASVPAGDGDQSGSSPFGDVAVPKQEQIWKDAAELGSAGMDLAEQAAKAKEAGDRDAFKSLGTQAKEKLAQALDVTDAWEKDLVATLGASHPEVKSIQRARNIWRNRLVALKKTVGF